MGKYLLIAGLLLNSGLITVNRFVKKLPDWLYLPLLIAGALAMLAGMILIKY